VSGPNSRLAHVMTATRDGSHGPSQDRIFTTPSAVIVLDGASQPEPSEHDGGWLAQVLGKQLADALTAEPDRDLAATLNDAIAAVADRHQLVAGRAPSTTVSIVRWTDDFVDVLVLGDSPVILHLPGGVTREIRDDRMSNLPGRESIHPAATGFGRDDSERWRLLVAMERAARNRPDGYWIAEAAPEAANHAITETIPRSQLAAALVITDGVAIGVDRYQVPAYWHSAVALAHYRLEALLDLVHAAEASDPNGQRWPRSERHDDKAAALVSFLG
jgi:hypothetical protein